MYEKRGVPIVGRGISSTMPGTSPLGALLAKEAREERKRARDKANRLRREEERRDRAEMDAFLASLDPEDFKYLVLK